MVTLERFHQPFGLISWLFYALACFWLALALSWRSLAWFDYAYPFWYQVLDIEEHIARYAPENVEKPGFEQLPPEQHKRAFAQISQAVHSDGAGLEALVYPGPDGQPVGLLTRDEVLHLKDVAALFRTGAWITVLALLLWVPLARAVNRSARPPLSHRLLAAGTPAVIAGAWVLVSGPKAVFYTLHDWLFPPEHPWFFYWEESLMSTLMKAPFLFGGIAVMILGGTLALTPLFYHLGLAIPAGRRAEGSRAD